MRGLSIAIEGLDGTGKSTLARDLALAMGAELLSTPGVHLAETRRRLETAYADSPVALQLFYASSVAAASSRICKLTDTGTDVVIDRYWLSTVVNAPLRGDCIEMPALERWLRPVDLTILVEIDESVRRERLERRGMTNHDRQTLDSTTARALRAEYRRGLLRPVAGRGIILDATGATRDDLATRVLENVDRFETRWRPSRPGQARSVPIAI